MKLFNACLILFFLTTLVCLLLNVTTYANERENDSRSEPNSKLRVERRSKSKCSAQRDKELDVCASKMGFLGDHSFRVPKNTTSMVSFCSELESSINCIQSYSRECLSGFTRQLLTGLLKRGKQQYHLICQDDKSKVDFIKKMNCLSDDKIMKFHNCMDASISRFEYIASRSVKPDARLPSLCCSYQIFNRDIELVLNEVCGKPLQRRGSTNEFVQKIVGATAGEFLALICENHRSLDDCKASKKTQSVLNKLEEVTKQVTAGKLVPKNKSLIPVLLQILDSSEATD